VSNGTLTLTNRMAVGLYGTTGLKLGAAGRLVCGGDPLWPNRIVWVVTFQELPPLSWVAGFNDTLLTDDSTATSASEIRMRFTETVVPGGRGRHFGGTGRLGRLALTDCQLTGGALDFNVDCSYSRVVAWTNNLFARVATISLGGESATMSAYGRNNLFWKCYLELNAAEGNGWEWRDNLFDSTTISQKGADIPANSNNGYVSCPDTIEPPGSGNKTLSSLVYETGTLGRWYLPSSSVLIDAGSRTAAQTGMYHDPVMTSDAKDGNSTVDIGSHYVACTDGKPIDGDSDGLPDYFEDYDGDNAVDAGDPVLAVDQSSGTVYLAGTSPRNSGGWNGIPVWRSPDGGLTYGSPSIVASTRVLE
jgi:hypothetical protein